MSRGGTFRCPTASRLDPKRFALPWERDKDSTADPQRDAQAEFPKLLDGLVDVAED